MMAIGTFGVPQLVGACLTLFVTVIFVVGAVLSWRERHGR